MKKNRRLFITLPDTRRTIRAGLFFRTACWMTALFASAAANAQLINSGAYINSTAGTSVLVSGDLTNTSAGATIQNDGTMTVAGNILNYAGAELKGAGTYSLSGNWKNAGTFTSDPTTNASTVVFTGAAPSELTSPFTIFGGAFRNLTLQKTGNATVTLQEAAIVTGILNFNPTSGGDYLALAGFDLTLGAGASVTGATPLAFAVTGGTGRLVTGLGGTPFTYPVGYSASTYNPVILTQTVAGTPTIGVRCLPHVFSNGTTGTVLTAGVADVAWELTEIFGIGETGGGPVNKNLTMTAQWAGAQELPGFDKTRCGISSWQGSAWDLLYANVGPESGSDPYMRSLSGITSTGVYVVGSKAVAKTVSLSAKVFLQGPYQSGGTMSTALSAGAFIPTGENTAAVSSQTPRPTGFTHQAWGGGEVSTQSIFTANNVVDWVFVELRTPGATPTSVVATASALLKKDGTIADENGVAPLTFYGVADGSYLVSVKHRNHLGVRSANALAFSSASAASIDFTVSLAGAYKPLNHPNEVMTPVEGNFGLWGGNVVNDGQIKYTGAGNDRGPIFSAIGGIDVSNTVNGYYREDVNLDGVVKYTRAGNDRGIIFQNIGGVNVQAIIKETFY